MKDPLLIDGFYCASRLLTLSGCHEKALGMQNGKIPDSAIKANYQVNAKHALMLVYSDDISGGLAQITISYFYRTHISFNILTRFVILLQ